MNVQQLKGLQQKILMLPKPAQERVLDDMETLIEHQGFITVGELNLLIRDQLH